MCGISTSRFHLTWLIRATFAKRQINGLAVVLRSSEAKETIHDSLPAGLNQKKDR